MSRVSDLLGLLAPEGVEFSQLGNLVRIRNGRDYKHLAVGDVPVYGSGGVMTTISEEIATGPSVLIPRKGSLSNLFYVEGPFWTVDTIFYTHIGDRLVPRFLYFFLLTQELEKLNKAGGVPSLTQSELNQIRVPVPPLEVQREIVRILDQFTELETQLEAELEARRTQLAHYRWELLRGHSANTTTLGAIASRVSTGATPRAGAPEYYQGGTIPWLRTGEVNFGEVAATENRITERALAETGVSWIEANCVIITSRAEIKSND